MKLTEAQHKWREWLRERGGSGTIDQYGRVVAQGEVAPIGTQTAWLHLVAKGCVAGDGGRIYLVEQPHA